MFPHSLRETIPIAQRARYLSEHGDSYECPGSNEYFGPSAPREGSTADWESDMDTDETDGTDGAGVSDDQDS